MIRFTTFKEVFDERLAKDAIINDRHTGHKQDYLLLHCLIRKYKPESFFEIGTNTGFGTLIIANALGDLPVFTLDLPPQKADVSKQHPIGEGKGDVTGTECSLPYHQIFADSRQFDYSQYPCEGYFIDSEHCYENVFVETVQVVLLKPKIVIWHDADVPEVFDAAVRAVADRPYELYRVSDTRILYAILKSE